MKITFCILVALVAVALALPTETDKPEEPVKVANPPTVTEEEKKTPNVSEESTTVSSNEEKAMTYPTQSPAKTTCSELIGKFVNGKFVGEVVNYDIEKILEKYGGPPGKLNTTWTEKEDAPVEKENLEKRPLPDADEKYWIYKYGDSDGSTYIRIEHAVRRFSGTPKAFLEIRGELYFTPDDFCGKSRKAHYTVDDRGFTSEVGHEYCWIGNTVSCAWPANCKADEDGNITSCVAAPVSALLATLVGGGK